MSVHGRRAFVLKEKLILIKSKMREWNLGEFGCLESRKKALKEISMLDKKEEEKGLSVEEVKKKISLRSFGGFHIMLNHF